VLFTIALLHLLDAIRSRAGAAAVNGALWLAAAIALQATLGILTLLNQAPTSLALAHQTVAIAVLTLAIFQVDRLAARRSEQPQQKLALPAAQIS
jgi:cytochrome c oxidase assembly protein subunit 15